MCGSYCLLVLLLAGWHSHVLSGPTDTEDDVTHSLNDDIIPFYTSITPDNRTLCPETPENRPPNRVDTTARLEAMRAAMEDSSLLPPGVDSLDAYFVPYEDEHVSGGADHDMRLLYMTGYSGSAGYAWVTNDVSRAAMWTDGRYWLQADQQMDCNWILMMSGAAGYPSATAWLNAIFPGPTQFSVGIDSKLVSISRWQSYEIGLNNNIELVDMLGHELVDEIWTEDRPDRPNNDIYEHTIDFAGVSWQDKVDQIQQRVADNNAGALVMHALDETAWIYNIRGTDRVTSPYFYSYAILLDTPADDAIRLYLVNPLDMISDVDIRAHLNTGVDGTCPGPEPTEHCVNVRDYADVMDDIAELAADGNVGSIWLDPSANYAAYNMAGQDRILQTSPIQSIKAIKNDVERVRFRDCLMRDSAALVEFMAELEEGIGNGETWTEISASDRATEIRSTYEFNRGISFNPISAVGPNAAVIHYSPSVETDTEITSDEVYLLDSGGQYLDGTTDTTRTFHLGTPTAEEIDAYTRVLMGHIDYASIVWPESSGSIDSHARAPLWEVGLDYNHGTSHGIGYFLSVHESTGTLAVGHFLSDEPGYYEDNNFGIRLESIVAVEVADTPNHFNDKDYLTFEALTLVPFEPNLIDFNMLTYKHRMWLNDFNARCLEEVGTYLIEVRDNQLAYDWLVSRTQPIPVAEQPFYNPRTSV